MRSLFFLALLGALCSQSAAFVAVSAPSQISSSAVAVAPTSSLVMTSANKKAKAACRKMKSSRSAVKRFKVTSTGKLLRHFAGKAHLLRKKRPQHKAHLRRVGQVNEAELLTYQKLLLVFPKRK